MVFVHPAAERKACAWAVLVLEGKLGLGPRLERNGRRAPEPSRSDIGDVGLSMLVLEKLPVFGFLLDGR